MAAMLLPTMNRPSIKLYVLCVLACSLLVTVTYLLIGNHVNMTVEDDLREDRSSSMKLPVNVSMTNKIKIVKIVRHQGRPEGVSQQTFHSPTKLLYLVQTEKCLPVKLLSSIGNASSCQCDILVLSYKEECLIASSIEYICNSSTTWTTGRNLLFEAAMRRSEKYLYYIFMDDDIEVQHREHKQGTVTRNPWRDFEQFLRRVEPAVAALKGLGFNPKEFVSQYSLKYDPMKIGYVHTVWFDAICNAFHYQAVEYILPYSTKYDEQSWWYSQIYTIIWSELLFRGQVLKYMPIDYSNPVHRPYPRHVDGKRPAQAMGEITPYIVQDIGEKLPQCFQNSSLFLQWKKGGYDHGMNTSSTYCLPPIEPHQKIQPYVHFNHTVSG